MSENDEQRHYCRVCYEEDRDCECYQQAFGAEVAAHILKLTAAARGIEAAQAGAVLGTSEPLRSGTAQGCND